jgi:GntR family transcriptional regulator/MocR family aminotransferase
MSLSDEEIVHHAAQVGVGIISAQPHYLKANCTGEFIFGYSELTEQQTQEGICRLAQVIEQMSIPCNSYSSLFSANSSNRM